MNQELIYIVEVENIETGCSHISQEGYRNFDDAKRFILSRTDKPTQRGTYLYISDTYVYKIFDIQLCGKSVDI